ncbi:amino acid permease [Dongshaea marina]|uniref:amino acid permease n=1 Tax=Dongshaea marina TaxID=2047966 RepID=UPI00131F1210|nr:aromatic amino acid transport family protein [Dongshaea marina]
MNFKLVGSALIVAGTALGAGMLGIPMVLAQLGLVLGTVMMLLVWGITCYAALLLLEVNLSVGVGSNMHAMAGKLLGRAGQLVTNGSMMFLLYSLLMAYIIGAADLLHSAFDYFGLQLPMLVCQLLFALLGAVVVICGTALVDRLNRALFALMIVFFLAALILMLPSSKMDLLLAAPLHAKGWLLCLPVLFTSFGFSVVIPSLVRYSGATIKQMRWIIIIGSAIPLLCYFLWLLACLGNLPEGKLLSMAGNVHAMVTALSEQRGHLRTVLNLFAAMALLTSFLGVALALFDLLAEVCKSSSSLRGRSINALLTLGLPTVIAIIAPNHFLAALSYAGIAQTIFAILIPSAMVWQLRRGKTGLSFADYRVRGGELGVMAISAFGVVLIAAQF